MANIQCGKCKATHHSVDAVKACYADAPLIEIPLFDSLHRGDDFWSRGRLFTVVSAKRVMVPPYAEIQGIRSNQRTKAIVLILENASGSRWERLVIADAPVTTL